MATRSVMDIYVDVKAGDLGDFQKKLMDAAKKASAGFDYRGMEQGFQKVSKNFAKMIQDASTAKIKLDVAALSKAKKEYVKTMTSAASELAKKEAQLREAELTKVAKRQLKRDIQNIRARMKEETAIIDQKIAGEQKVLDMAKEHIAFMKKGAGEITKELGDGFSKAVDGFYADLKSGDLGSILSSMGSGSKGMSKAFKNFGAAQSGKGGMMGGLGKAASKMGAVLGKIGPMIAGLAGVVAGFAAIVKVILDANSQQKEFNRNILEGVGGFEVITSKMGGAEKSLKSLRRAAIDGAFAQGALAKELIAVTNAFNQAGFTYKEMAKDLENAAQAQSNFARATDIAFRYSRLLGMTATETATQMAESMEDLNLTLEGVAERFSAVSRMAMESGFGVKRFFSMVLQATSGMSMYNVRLEEAAGLLLQLGKILGTKIGGDFLSQMGKGFVNESMQDRTKRVMLTGRRNTRTHYELTAEDTARDFQRNVLDLVDSQGTSTSNIFDGASANGINLGQIDFSNMTDKEKKALQGLTSEEMDEILGRVKLNVAGMGGDGDAIVRQLETLINVSRGASGKMSHMVTEMASLDFAGQLGMTLDSVSSMFGDQQLHELNYKQLMAVENLTGLTGEQLEQMRKISRGLTAQFKQAQRIADNEDKNDKEALARYAKNNNLTVDTMSDDDIMNARYEEQVRQVKALGGYIKDGKFISAVIDELGQVVDSGQSFSMSDKDAYRRYVHSRGDAINEQSAQEMMSMDDALSQEIADNTYDIKNALEQGTNWLLERISGVVSGIWSYISDDKSDKNRADTIERLQKVMDTDMGELRQVGVAIKEAQRKARTASDPAERALAAKEVEDLTAKKEQLMRRRVVTRNMMMQARDKNKGKNIDWSGDAWWNPFDEAFNPAEADKKLRAAAGQNTAVRQQMIQVSPQTIGEVAARAVEATQTPEAQRRIAQFQGMNDSQKVAAGVNRSDQAYAYAFRASDVEGYDGPTSSGGFGFVRTQEELSKLKNKETGEVLARGQQGVVAMNRVRDRLAHGTAYEEGALMSGRSYEDSALAKMGLTQEDYSQLAFGARGLLGIESGTARGSRSSSYVNSLGDIVVNTVPTIRAVEDESVFNPSAQHATDTTGPSLEQMMRNRSLRPNATSYQRIYEGSVADNEGQSAAAMRLYDNEQKGMNVGPYLTQGSATSKLAATSMSIAAQETIDSPRDIRNYVEQETLNNVEAGGNNTFVGDFLRMLGFSSKDGKALTTANVEAVGQNPLQAGDSAAEQKKANDRRNELLGKVKEAEDSQTGTFTNLINLLNDDEKKRLTQVLRDNKNRDAAMRKYLSGDFMKDLEEAFPKNEDGSVGNASPVGVTADQDRIVNTLAAIVPGQSADEKNRTAQGIRDTLTQDSALPAHLLRYLNHKDEHGKARWERFGLSISNTPSNIFRQFNDAVITPDGVFQAHPGDKSFLLGENLVFTKPDGAFGGANQLNAGVGGGDSRVVNIYGDLYVKDNKDFMNQLARWVGTQ